MTDNKNTILAIALSALVLIAWQFFFAMPQEKARQEKLQAEQQKQQQTQQQQPEPAGAPRSPARRRCPAKPVAQSPAAIAANRDAALEASPRVAIATDSVQGSIALKGGRIDDLSLVKFRETVDPTSPPIVLLSPSGSPEPVLRRIRLDRRRRRHRQGSRPGHGVDSRKAPAA